MKTLGTHMVPIVAPFPLLSIDAQRIERRYRCIDTRHAGHLYNSAVDKTWCRCGWIVRSGYHVTTSLSRYERAETDWCRMDGVGRQARDYLASVHGGGKTEAGEALCSRSVSVSA
ncbi:hypothetical protein [Nocardia sp. NPDC059691]|uniref:hypothetical protein n=1 Tax=Nocardia sp. NPDC059691 TaxID=3346908 RepID=UPI0036C4134A